MSDTTPMPTPYTTENTGFPVGLYMPNTYYRPEYLAWLRDRQPIPFNERHFDADEAIAPKPGNFRSDETRVCVICDAEFTPRGFKQATCGDPECRRKNRNARSAASYAKTREAA